MLTNIMFLFTALIYRQSYWVLISAKNAELIMSSTTFTKRVETYFSLFIFYNEGARIRIYFMKFIYVESPHTIQGILFSPLVNLFPHAFQIPSLPSHNMTRIRMRVSIYASWPFKLRFCIASGRWLWSTNRSFAQSCTGWRPAVIPLFETVVTSAALTQR